MQTNNKSEPSCSSTTWRGLMVALLLFVGGVFATQAQECQWTISISSNYGDSLAWELRGPDGSPFLSRNADFGEAATGTFSGSSAGPVEFYVTTDMGWGDNTASWSIANENGIIEEGSIGVSEEATVSGMNCNDEGEPLPGPCDANAFEGNSGFMQLACNSGNIIHFGNTTVCGTASSNYLGGEEAVVTYTPSESGIATISYEGQSWSAIFVFEGCPTDGDNCVDAVGSSTVSKSLSFPAVAGTEYYIVIDTWPVPNSPCPGSIEIELEDGCEGTPDAGVLSISDTEGEPDSNATINLEGYSEGPGINYILIYTVDGENEQYLELVDPSEVELNFDGEPGSVFELKILVGCSLSGEGALSNPVYYTLTGLEGYCDVQGSETYGIQYFETTGGDQNISNQSGADGYADYTDMVVSQAPGASIDFVIQQNTSTAGMAIWVDWNNDNFFSDSEKVFNAGSYVSLASGTIVVPDDAAAGDYRMRVVSNYLSMNPQPCGFLGSSSAYGEAEDYTFTVLESSTCQGAFAGEVEDSSMVVCAGNSFVLSTVGATSPADGNEGLTRIWQSSPAGEDNWTDIEGASSSTLEVSGGILEDTDYRYVVTCGDASDSVEISVSLNPNVVDCMCTPSISTIEEITLVDFAGIYDDEANVSDGYVDNKDMMAEVDQGESYEITLQGNSNGPYTNTFTVWVDWNQNGVFEDGERYEIGTIYDSNGNDGDAASAAISVPEDALEGVAVMRVIKNFSSYASNPCGSYTWGQAKDYSVNVSSVESYECDIEVSVSVQEDCVEEGGNYSASVLISGGLEGDEFTIVLGGDTLSISAAAGQPFEIDAVWLDAGSDYQVSVFRNGDWDCSASASIESPEFCEDDNNDPYSLEDTNDVFISSIVINSGFGSTYDLNYTSDAKAEGGYGIIDSPQFSVFPSMPGVFSLTSGGAGDNGSYYYKIWIDLDQDGDFDDSLAPQGGELFIISGGAVPNDYVGQLTFPDFTHYGGLEPGVYQARIRNSAVGQPDPHGYGDGEALDFTINILSAYDAEYLLDVDSQVFQNFTFYPNPVQSQLNLNAGNTIEQVQVFNLLGQQVIQVNPNALDAVLDLDRLESGVYMMSVTIDGAQKSFRIIKK